MFPMIQRRNPVVISRLRPPIHVGQWFDSWRYISYPPVMFTHGQAAGNAELSYPIEF